MVALGLVDPLPAQILAKVNVELPYAAVLLCGAADRDGTQVRRAEGLPRGQAMPLPGRGGGGWQGVHPVIITAIIVVVMIMTNTDKALPLVKHCAKGIRINIVSCNA